MALKATVFKADLQISDLDRQYYQSHSLTLARHPSETDERMMVRLLAFALYADEALAFGRGLSAEDEPDLWLRDPTGAIDVWIEVGLPDERDVRKACGRAQRVVVMSYGRAADVWWQKNKDKLQAFPRVTVVNLSAEEGQALAALASRTMRLQCTIQDGLVWITAGDASVQIEPKRLLPRG